LNPLAPAHSAERRRRRAGTDGRGVASIETSNEKGVKAMCLAVPGKVVSIEGDDPILRDGKVNFGGVVKRVNLSYVPEAKIGDYVVVHVGLALSIVDEEEAKQVFEFLKTLGELSEIEGESNLEPV
jgi:hydrogenase expression/formation protein HypC